MNFLRFNFHYYKLQLLSLFLLLGMFSCKDDPRIVELFDKGVVNATASSNSISEGGSVTFEESSTKVQSLVWAFPGGSPASSTSSNVTVTYANGGTYEATLTVVFVDNTTEKKVFPIEVIGAPVVKGPYLGFPLSIPGTLQVENYDLGGEGVSYHDTEEENRARTAGSARYRDDDGVDLEVSTDGSLVNIGYATADEWTEYTVNVQEAAAYDFEFVVASLPGGTAVKLQLVDANGTISDIGELAAFPSTGGWGTYIPIKLEGINLTAGEQVLRLAFTGGNVNIDKINISAPGVVVVEKYGIYTEGSVTTGFPSKIELNNAFLVSPITTGTFEGSESLFFEFNSQDTWGVMAALRPADAGGNFVTADISEYATGFYNITLKTTCLGKMNIRLQGGGINGFVQLDDAVKTYGFQRDGAWHTLKIPIADFKTATNEVPNYAQISHFMVLRSAEAAVTATEEWDWYVDNVYLSKE